MLCKIYLRQGHQNIKFKFSRCGIETMEITVSSDSKHKTLNFEHGTVTL